MSNYLQLDGLLSLANQKNEAGAREFIENIVNFFERSLTKSEIEFALEKIFCTAQGTIAFLKRTLSLHKHFQDSNTSIFTLWNNLLVKYSASINFVPYTQDIADVCLKFITSSFGPSSKERERATIVLRLLVERKVVTEELAALILDRSLNIFNLKKIGEMFTNEIFKMIGILVKLYPHGVTEQQHTRIKTQYLKAMDSMTNNQEARFLAVCGALEGFKDYLECFSDFVSDEEDTLDRIYVCMKALCALNNETRKKNTFRAAIELFTLHSTLFSKFVFHDFKYWQACIEKWTACSVYEDRKRGVSASYAFHQIIANELKAGNSSDNKETLQFILTEFRKTLESPNSKPEETRIAIKGFGTMSLLCKRFLPSMLNDMLSLVVQRCELILLADDKTMRDVLNHFPDYIRSLSTVVKELRDPQVTDVLVDNLKNVIIRLVREFHFLPALQYANVANSIHNAFQDVYLTDIAQYERLVNKVIFEGIVWTCSHKSVHEADEIFWGPDTDWKDKISYKSYRSLWHALLAHDEQNSDEKKAVTDKIFDNFMLSLFRILDKLDLRTQKRVYSAEDGTNLELYICDPNFDLCPVRPKDFHIFNNIVDFYRDLWPQFRRQHFSSWIEAFCDTIVKLCLRNPLVSGFLKLLEMGMEICVFLDLSKDLSPELVITLTHIFKVMIVRCQRVSGELQISIIELLFQFPVSFYDNHLLDMIPIFETALDLGKSMSWLAHLSIECLERISAHSRHDNLKRVNAKVLPLLDAYLQSHCAVEVLPVRMAHSGNKLQKGVWKKRAYFDTLDIQTKIVSYLGKLPSEVASLLVLNSVHNQNLVKWDSKKCVHLDLRMADINPVVYLDTLIPRICQLALTSTDRHTKIASCEIVHALVLYLIGSRGNHGQIWVELCKRILLLGCDVDETVQQMFEPLLLQVMHFMSRYENLDRGVEEMMDVLMDGICNKSNLGLRDLSASCLREFVEWSIKQTTPQQLEASAVSIEIILGKLKMFCFDSDGCKRVGAAIAFNNLYRLLREKEVICDMFFVDLLHTFCVNLKLSEELTHLPPSDSINWDLETVSEALDHVVRVLSERNYLYQKPSEKRLVPSAMNSGTLVDVVAFLILQTGTGKMFYRQKCMKLAGILAARIDGISSLEQFFLKCQLPQFPDEVLLEICEGTRDSGGIQACQTISYMLRPFHEYPERFIYKWLEYFLKSLENFAWLMREKAITPKSKVFEQSKTLRVVAYYLEEVCYETLAALLERHTPKNSLIKDLECAEKIKTIKGFISLNILNFLTELVRSKCNDIAGLDSWDLERCEALQKMVITLLHEPQKLGIDYRLMKQVNGTGPYIERFADAIKDSDIHPQLYININSDITLSLPERLFQFQSKMEQALECEDFTEFSTVCLEGVYHILKRPNISAIITKNQAKLAKTAEHIARTCFEKMTRTCSDNIVVTNHPENVRKFARKILSIAFMVHDMSDLFVDFILHDVELCTANLNVKIKFGYAFFERYESVINEHVSLAFFKKCLTPFSKRPKEEQNYVLRVLTGILDHRRKTQHDVQGKFGEIVTYCMQNLPCLLCNFTNQSEDFQLIEYLSVLAAIPGTDSLTISHQVPELGKWIIGKLRSPQLSLEKKCKIISLLPILLGPADYENPDLMSALEDLQSRHLPLKSNEFCRNSLEETSLKHTYITLLNALMTSKSYVILEFLFKTTACDQKHLMEDEIYDGIKTFTQSLSNEEQVEVLKRTLTIVLNDFYEPALRLVIFRRFLLNIFKHSSEEALMNFMRTIIKRVSEILESNYRVSNAGRAVEQALVNRIIGFGLVEHFVGTVTKELYTTVQCPVAIELLGTPQTPSEFVGIFTKKAFYVRTEEFPTPNKDAAELFRKYQCAAYNALCSLVCNTQTELKFYSKFLFEENSRRNEFIWARLVDCSSNKSYLQAGQEEVDVMKVKKRFVAIRQLNVQPTVSLKSITNAKRFQTQNIMESSLHQDIQAIDLTSHSIRSHADALRRDTLRTAESMSIDLEMNEMNNNEVMDMLCGVIKHMHVNNITPVITDINVKRSYPWVQAIANAIESNDYHKYIRIFLAQVVDNCSEFLSQFAHVLFKPLLRMLSDECAGRKLNSFITDIIVLLLNWSTNKLHTLKESEAPLVNDVLRFVLANVWAEQKAVLKFNLELIQTMLVVWKDVIKVPSSLLLEMVTRTRHGDSTGNECGVVVLGLVLSNGIVPWTDINKILFINAMLTNLENESASIYQAAAYDLGASLSLLIKSGDQASADNLLTEIRGRLQALHSRKDNKSERRFMDILYNVHKECPQVVDSLREIICFKIPTSVGVTKRNYLEMVLSRIESFEEDEVYNTIIGIGIQDLLKHADYQLLALHILNRSIPMLKKHNIYSLFDLVQESLQVHSPKCREVAYEVCIYIAQNFTSALRDQAVKLLFKAVSDPNADIQKRIYQFWSKDMNMSPKIVERLTDLLRRYAANGERHFLSLCTQLILDPVVESADAKKQIFAFEEDRDAKLHEYKIKTSSIRRENYKLPPLFSESAQPRSSLFKSTQFCSLVGNTNADYVFEPTQDPRSIAQAKQGFTLQSQSSLPFEIATQVLDRRSQKVAVETKTQTPSTIARKRFVKDSEKALSENTVKVIERRRKQRENLSQFVKDNTVTLYRRYRYGDYPDLLINKLAFLLPLQALARRDVLIAKDLFVSVCAAILETEESDPLEFFQEFNDIFQILLRKSSIFESTTVTAFLELSLLKPSAFTIPPEKVAKVAKLTKNLTLGALYLEERLNADWDEDIISQQETQHWLQLSDIYSSLKEYEVVSAIFSDKIRTDPKLAKAIELRANGRADEAQTLLVKIMGRNVHVEHYYAYNCYYECAIELGHWAHLDQAIKKEVDNWEELWTDEYNVNFLLPKLLQAKVQLTLAGDTQHHEIIKTWFKDPDKFEYVKKEMCEEVMMLLMVSRSFRQCRVIYENYLKRFLREWSVASSYHTKTKLETLLNGQRVAEIDYYAQVFVDTFNSSTPEKLCSKWSLYSIDPTESLHVWNSVIGYRKYIAMICCGMLQEQQDLDQNQEKQAQIMRHIYNFNLQLFNVAVQQKNFALAQNVYDRLRPNENDTAQVLTHRISKIKNIYLQSQRSISAKGAFEIAWNSLTILLHDEALTRSPLQHIESLELKSKMLQDMVENIELHHFEKLPEKSLRDITGLLPTDDLKIGLIKQALQALKDEEWISGRAAQTSAKKRDDSFLNLARFCYDRLNYVDSEMPMSVQLQKLFIHGIMKAMVFGSKEARQLFPCVLQLESIKNGVLQKYFVTLSADVPVWTYIAWIPQILSHFKLNERCYLDEVVHKLSVKYPEALRYPFTIWYKESKFKLSLDESLTNYQERSVITAVKDALNHKLCDKFVRSFKYLAIPEAFLSAQLESFERDIRNHPQITQEQYTSLATRLIEEVYCEEGFLGDAYRRLLKYKTELQNLKELTFSVDEERIRKTLVDTAQALRGYLRKTHSLTIETSVQLENICPWLDSYQWCGEEDSIELPGQYTKMSWETNPNTAGHIKIVRFNSKIKVLVSQRYPLRITINGSNGHSYDFLVKHGEDLKQDQRIQQILELMSEKLREDRNCLGHNLFIRTYRVVPIERNCGILSWVTNTASLHDLILNCFARRCPNSNEIVEQTTKNYLEFIGRASYGHNTSNFTVYGTAASRYSRDHLIQNQRALENRIDHDILKKALMDLALSPATYFALRNNFATTLAAMNIAHWILGVGDRHLQNILISIKDATVTGIDFGFTFGSGTRDQKVPELTPFRLTPHLVNVMSPMGTSGLIYKCMVYALKVFRRADRILLACMEVFIREPSINWLDSAMNRMSDDDEVIMRDWEPKDRIDIARCKLQGFNPMYLFERELNVGLISRDIDFLAGYMKILRGHMQFNERSRLGRDRLTAEQQVNCLIDQATDPAVLGISYVGFAPWI